MGIFDKFKNKVKEKAGDVFMDLISPAKADQLEIYLKTPSFLNPTAAVNSPWNAYDQGWPYDKLLDFIKSNECPAQSIMNGENGEILVYLEYKNHEFDFHYSLHNARVVSFTLFKEIGKVKDISKDKFNSYQNKVNRYNIKDDIHRIGITFSPDNETMIFRFSSLTIVTDVYGNKNTIQKAFDDLLEYGEDFIDSPLDFTPSDDYFEKFYFKPSKISDLEDMKVNDQWSSAIECWFGREGAGFLGTLGDGKGRLDGNMLVRTFPFPITQGMAQYKMETIEIPLENDRTISATFEKKDLETISLKVNKSFPCIYKIEAKNIIQNIGTPENYSGNLNEDKIKDICRAGNLSLSNLLIKFVMEKNSLGQMDISLIACGLHYGSGQSWAKLDVIGEILKWLTVAYLLLGDTVDKDFIKPLPDFKK